VLEALARRTPGSSLYNSFKYDAANAEAPYPLWWLDPHGDAYAALIRVAGTAADALGGAHDALGLPWWAAIVLAGAAARGATLPLNVLSLRNAARAQDAAEDLAAVRGAHAQASLAVSRAAAAEAAAAAATANAAAASPSAADPAPRSLVAAGARLRLLAVALRGYRAALHRARCYPLRSLAVPLVQVPVALACVLGARHAVLLGDRSFETEGLAWFSDLTVPDPLFALPMLSLGLAYLSLDAIFAPMRPPQAVAAAAAAAAGAAAATTTLTAAGAGAAVGAPALLGARVGAFIKNAMQTLLIVSAPFAVALPAGLHLLMAANSAWTLAYLAVVRQPRVYALLTGRPMRGAAVLLNASGGSAATAAPRPRSWLPASPLLAASPVGGGSGGGGGGGIIIGGVVEGGSVGRGGAGGLDGGSRPGGDVASLALALVSATPGSVSTVMLIPRAGAPAELSVGAMGRLRAHAQRLLLLTPAAEGTSAGEEQQQQQQQQASAVATAAAAAAALGPPIADPAAFAQALPRLLYMDAVSSPREESALLRVLSRTLNASFPMLRGHANPFLLQIAGGKSSAPWNIVPSRSLSLGSGIAGAGAAASVAPAPVSAAPSPVDSTPPEPLADPATAVAEARAAEVARDSFRSRWLRGVALFTRHRGAAMTPLVLFPGDVAELSLDVWRGHGDSSSGSGGGGSPVAAAGVAAGEGEDSSDDESEIELEEVQAAAAAAAGGGGDEATRRRLRALWRRSPFGFIGREILRIAANDGASGLAVVGRSLAAGGARAIVEEAEAAAAAIATSAEGDGGAGGTPALRAPADLEAAPAARRHRRVPRLAIERGPALSASASALAGLRLPSRWFSPGGSAQPRPPSAADEELARLSERLLSLVIPHVALALGGGDPAAAAAAASAGGGSGGGGRGASEEDNEDGSAESLADVARHYDAFIRRGAPWAAALEARAAAARAGRAASPRAALVSPAATVHRSGERMWLSFALPPGVHVGVGNTAGGGAGGSGGGGAGDHAPAALPEVEAWLSEAQAAYRRSPLASPEAGGDGAHED